jgi:hypothetical protein
MKRIKEEDLILYLYRECTPSMTTAIEAALEEDITLQDRLKTLKRTLKQLDKIKLKQPSKASLKAILKQAAEPARKKK